MNNGEKFVYLEQADAEMGLGIMMGEQLAS